MTLRIALLFVLLVASRSSFGQVVLRQFPIYQQPDEISCGPACAAMVLMFNGVDAGIEPLKMKAGTTWIEAGNFRLGMTLPEALARAMTEYRISTAVREGSIRDLPRYIDNDIPQILLVRSGPTLLHYIVVFGYNNHKTHFRIADPGAGESYWISASDLNGIWQFSHMMDDRRFDDRLNDVVQTVRPADRKCGVCDGSGRMVNAQCPLCRGTGEIRMVVTNPFTNEDHVVSRTRCTCNNGRITTSCGVCGGSGDSPDMFRKLIESNGVRGNTILVPVRTVGPESEDVTMARNGANDPFGIDPQLIYVCVNRCFGLVLDVAAIEGNPNGAPIRGWERNGQNNQLWRFEPAGPNQYRIRSVWGGKCVDQAIMNGGRPLPRVHSWECVDQPNQVWSPEPAGPNQYRFRNVGTGHYLDMGSAPGRRNDLPVMGCDRNRDDMANQVWQLEPVGREGPRY